MLDIGFVCLLAVWPAGLGLWVLERLGTRPEESSDALALAMPIGLGVLGLSALGLGEVGALHLQPLLAVLAIGLVLGTRPLLDLGRKSLHGMSLRSIPREPPDLALFAALGLAIVGTLLTAMAPVTDGDALCYHLQVPKLFLARGSVGFDPDLHETVYPLLTEMLYAVALAFRGPVACRLVQWLLGLVFLLGVSCLARPWLGARAWWAGTVAMLVPAVSNGMSAPLNDVALAAFGTAALLAWSRYQDAPSSRMAMLTGLLCGLAAGVKYPALVLVGLLGKTLLFERTSLGARILHRLVSFFRWRSRRRSTGLEAQTQIDPSTSPRRRLPHWLVFALFALLVGGCWYARAYVHTGNPVYPFFRQVFGGSGLDEVLAPEKRPLNVTFWSILTALKPLTLDPDRFDSLSHQFGPAFLLFLPALLVMRPPRRVLGLAAIGQAFLMICMTQRQSMRFLLIAIGPLAVGVAWLAKSWWERRSLPGRLLVGLLVLVLAFESTIAMARARHGLRVVLGVESTASYLARREPTYRVGQWVAGHLPEDARIIGQDHRGFYFPRDYTMELAHRRRTGLGRNGESPAEVIDHFEQAGFTHLLLCPPEPENAVEFDPTLSRLLDPWLASQAPLYHERLTDADGVARLYTVYALPRPDMRNASRPPPEGRVRR